MKRDQVLGTIAKAIVWFEDLALEIKAARFVSTSKLIAKKNTKPLAVDYIEVVVIKEDGTVMGRHKEFKPAGAKVSVE